MIGIQGMKDIIVGGRNLSVGITLFHVGKKSLQCQFEVEGIGKDTLRSPLQTKGRPSTQVEHTSNQTG